MENQSKFDPDGYALECQSCGAPSNGMSHCQWCGSTIPYFKPADVTKVVYQQSPASQTLDTLARGFSTALYTIAGIKL